MLFNQFYKISHHGGTYVTGKFYNPVTGEHKNELLRDYDYDDGSRDNDDLYYMEINEDALRHYLHHVVGTILVGDVVKVVKGRTLPIGYTGKVKDIREYKDRYGRYLADYLYFEDGQKINAANCEIVEYDDPEVANG